MKHQLKNKDQKNNNKKGYKRYRTIIEENVSKLLTSGDLQESYNKWSVAIETSIKTTENKNKKSKERYQRAAKNSQKIERRIFNHRRTS